MTEAVELTNFVTEAISASWPNNTVPRNDDEFPSFYNSHYNRSPWRYVDLWAGATTDAGMQIVFNREAPVWACAYRGGIIAAEYLTYTVVAENPLYAFLIEALGQPADPSLPLRGPERYVSAEGRWSYTFNFAGSIESFRATEHIEENGNRAYERVLIGGRIGDGVAYGQPIA